jgi:hypothetical protein
MRKSLLLALIIPLFLHAQALLPPWLNGQFTDANGHPLSNGRVYFCVAQSSCPGTPQPAFTSSSGASQLANPSILDASGRIPSGIWLTAGLTYKIVVTTSLGVVIPGAGGDNILGASGSAGGAGTNFWTLSGSAIANNNGAGGGDVNAGGNLKAAGNLTAGLSLKIGNGNVNPNYVILKSSPAMSLDASWTWPRVDNVGVLTSDGAGNLVFAPGGGGGGSGTPGGPTTSVQYNDGTNLAGSGNFVWDNTNQILKVTSTSSNIGVNVVAGYVGSDLGFVANPSTATAFNTIRAVNGGMTAVSFTAQHYVNTGHSLGAPTPTSGDVFNAGAGGAMYCDTGSSPCVEKLWNGSAWVTLATGGATSPGGTDTNVQFNSAGSFAGSAHFWWDNTAQILHIDGISPGSSAQPVVEVGFGKVLSDFGFGIPFGVATRYDSIGTPGSGMQALSFTASNYITSGSSAGPPGSGGGSAPITPGDALKLGMMFCDSSVSPCVEKYWNGSAWVAMSGGGGGGGTPGGADTQVQFNAAGAFAASSNLTWQNVPQVLTVHGTGSNQALTVAAGYVQSDNGFKLLPFGVNTRFDAFQAVGAGMLAQSFTAVKYIQTGSSSGTPTLTTGDTFQPGAMYWDTGAGAEKVFNGSTWGNIGGGGGVASLNALTGALNIVGSLNQVTVTPFGSTITLTLPQQIATNSSVQFMDIVSGSTGGSFAFNTSNFNFLVNGNGVVNVSNSTGAYQVGSANVIDNAAHFRGNTYVAGYGSWPGFSNGIYSFMAYNASSQVVAFMDGGNRPGLGGAGQVATTDSFGTIRSTMDGVNGFFTSLSYNTNSGNGGTRSFTIGNGFGGSCTITFVGGIFLNSTC